MPNCRSIPPAVWEHVRQALVFYFSRRHGITNAEDLAHETIAAVLTREDFEFACQEDFLRVCYGFAGRVSQNGYRQTRKHAGDSAAVDSIASQALQSRTVTLSPPEMAILLQEVLQAGESRLSTTDWQLIREASSTDRATLARDMKLGDANNVRVRLFRARKKLAKLTGWNDNAL